MWASTSIWTMKACDMYVVWGVFGIRQKPTNSTDLSTRFLIVRHLPNNDKYVHLFRVMNALDLQKTIKNNSAAIANHFFRASNYWGCERQLLKMRRHRIEEIWTEEHREKKQKNSNVKHISCQCHWRGSKYSRILSSQKNDWNSNSEISWFATLDSWLHYYVSSSKLDENHLDMTFGTYFGTFSYSVFAVEFIRF